MSRKPVECEGCGAPLAMSNTCEYCGRVRHDPMAEMCNAAAAYFYGIPTEQRDKTERKLDLFKPGWNDPATIFRKTK